IQVVFADGLDHLLDVNSLPTVVVIDRAGKIAYRAEGFGEGTFERDLMAAANHALEDQPTTLPRGTSAP
ncbi:MAG TPA: hypothetical protein VN850_01240, partial [Candidatus Acidoferrales bacterium]|nr:hypothetical protein [Candidatus Acidoferrales bacterium]